MLHPRDPGGERLTGKAEKGRRTARPAGRFASPRRPEPAATAAPPDSSQAMVLPAALRPNPTPALRRAAGPTPHRSAAPARRRGEGGAMQRAPTLSQWGGAGGGDMQSTARGGQWGGALRLTEPPLSSAGRGAAPRSAAQPEARPCSAPCPRRVLVTRGPARAAACAQAGPRGPVPLRRRGLCAPRR